MRKFFLPALWALIIAATGVASAQGSAPSIYFTDINSGPNTGGASNNGVFVTIYGSGFGATQGTSTVTVGGGVVASCPVWGAKWLWYQKTTCQLGANAKSGNIVVKTSAGTSNGIPFTVRAGGIYFVSTSGSDSAAGSFAAPWKTMTKLRSTVKAGDTVYLRAGTWSALDDDRSTLLVNGKSGTAAAPIAVSGYPGETATISAGTHDWAIADTYSDSNWWTFSNITIADAGDIGVYWSPTDTKGARMDGIRFVGTINHNIQSCPWEFNGDSSSSQMLGNDVYDFALESPSTGVRGYGWYYGGYGAQTNIEIGWNYVHYDGALKLGSRGLQMYGHCPQAGQCPDKTDLFQNVVFHDNVVKGMGRSGILLGGSDGTGDDPFKDDNTQYIYNNVFVANGATDLDYGYSAIQFGNSSSGTGTFKVYNNTFYGNGNSPLPSASGDIDDQGVTSIEIVNNAFYAPSSSSHYCGYVCFEVNGKSSQVSGHHNLFYNFGNGPSWSTNSISGKDPLFVNPSTDMSVADFHLQSSSPAKDVGYTESAVTHDVVNVSRPQGSAYDIGAYEYYTGTTASKPAAPTNLSVVVK